MREINRIARILKLIKKIWDEVPDQRLGQLLNNYGGFETLEDSFYWQDDDLEMYLKNTLEEWKKKS